MTKFIKEKIEQFTTESQRFQDYFEDVRLKRRNNISRKVYQMLRRLQSTQFHRDF